MNPIRHIRRIAAVLAGLAAALVAAGATPAFAMRVPYPNAVVGVLPNTVPVVTHTVVLGGMPGWQIALIAAGTALLAAAIAVLADRARAAHRKAIPAA